MSDASDPPKVGYKKPPTEHRFKKGQPSPNPKGRPPKADRSFLPQQLVRDILAVTEAKRTIRTSKGARKVATIEAVLMRMGQKALDGHGPSLRFLYNLHAQAITQHYSRYKDNFEFLEMVEDSNVTKPVPRDNERFFQEFINRLREETRRL